MSLLFSPQRARSPDTERTEQTRCLAPCPLCRSSVRSVTHALDGSSMISIRIVHVCDDFDGHKKARKTPVRPTRIDRAPIGALRATIALRSLCLFAANGLVAWNWLRLRRGAKYPGYPGPPWTGSQDWAQDRPGRIQSMERLGQCSLESIEFIGHGRLNVSKGRPGSRAAARTIGLGRAGWEHAPGIRTSPLSQC
jgi:hypothetical protein